ncbi:hypothetical protein PALB_28020 [Pseudoalteromonas luteoviolacea B = ATCC 29581]|nr:hypothetical protein PALB_28020 [Pseudoalteromonas luteoviolacea B = ATCC 29581]
MNPFICKARLNVADLFHHVNHLESFTAAVGRHESIEHFVLKMLGFCALSYLNNVFWKKDEDKHSPDLWIASESGQYDIAMLCGKRDVEQVAKLARKTHKLSMLLATNEVKEVQSELGGFLVHHHNVSIFSVDSSFVLKLADSLTQSLHWDVVIDNGMISVSNKRDFFESEVIKLT